MSMNQPEQGGGSSSTDASMGDVVAEPHDETDIDKLKEDIEELKEKERRLIELIGAANFSVERLTDEFAELSRQEQDQLLTQPESSTEPVELTKDGLKKKVKERNPFRLGQFIRDIQEAIEHVQKAIKLKEGVKDAIQKAAREQVSADSGLVPSTDLRRLDFEVTVNKGSIKEINYNKKLVWKAGDNIGPTDAGTLTNQAKELLTSDQTVDPNKLKALLLECLPQGERDDRLHDIQDWTDHYVVYANQRSLHHLVHKGRSEMFLQQAIYPPISLLLQLFAFVLQKSSHYAADQEILSAHSIKNKTTDLQNCFKGCPDAAIRLTAAHYVVATMEIQAVETIDQDDLAKCILLTSMSLVAYHEWSQKNCPRASKDIQGMKLPFVVGFMGRASLYVTSLCESENKFIPKVERVYNADISEKTGRIRLVTGLAVLLRRAMTVVRANEPDWDWTLPKMDNIISGTSSKQESSTKRSNQSTSEGEKGKQARRFPENKKDEEGGSRSASYAETSAKQALGLLGTLTNLMYPWHRVQWLTFSAEEQRRAEFEFYRQKSPFYFVGHFTADGQKDHRDVFCKVWKDGDRKTNRQEIVEEIEHLRLANKLGVPSPKVVEEATHLDLKLTQSLDSSTYHVLTMTKAKNDAVARCQVFDYAVSLIHAVRMLHEKAGMLHCDIKPANVSWNANEHKALLLDFGHAQSELNAKSYLGTKGYEAPEVLDDKPHTRASDAYSVGITLQKVMESADRSESNRSSIGAAGVEMQMQLVANLAQGLTREFPEHRLTLDQAEMSLTSSSFQCSSNEDSPPHKKGRYHSQESLITP